CTRNRFYGSSYEGYW
nr:immunoglobulin heavy chain junction region [Macaca mulatta]MOV49005.1 immunoglobulin heavy chain junction region [Macaca mulatta]MOV49184.1 immunoglobulin heavy chain junction region [Macaca mulatta]MOV49259.1 immunoglobulin heavy chain junction region [Macaca mulatta]MOV49358.1 immunoglobulin heavy chain junction region [Macaca mulatta]